jgi:CubicO group peptidase (beta-lactamase class C family)
VNVDQVLAAATQDGTTPGAAALVVTRGGRRLSRCAGTLHRGPHAPPVDEDTVWDLASLTKLLSTTILAARAVDEDKLALDEQPWPAWPGVTVEHVLRHESGLPAWRPLFEEAKRIASVGLPAGRRVVVDAARATAPELRPGEKTVYSDIGMIALGALLEERLGARLEEAFVDVARGTWGPGGLRFVRLDVEGFHGALPRVAPTERCPWRRRALQGQVHDENCFAMGGVAGHAGLFGSLLDVENAARALLDVVVKGGSTLARFAELPDGARRPIGFDRTTPGGSTGDALGPRTVGHLGFTGTSLWLDPDGPDGGVAYVLLTNRVHETREGPEKILALRKAFHRAASSWVSTSS